jgi:hypothetical protein
MKKNNLKPLAITFFLSGIWDTIAAFLYFFIIGSGRLINTPPIDPFFSIFLGSFFICFAYLQFLSARNIERYAFNVGCLVIGRLFYVIQLYAYMLFVQSFPSTFWFTGIIDGLFIILYLVFAVHGGLRYRDLFLSKREVISV